MKAVVIPQPGPAEVLTLAERPTPAVGPKDVLIRVKAAGVNRADLIQRDGKYPAPAGVVPDIPGLEVSGVVEACGDEVKRWRQGDAVCALLAGGGYAEQVVIDAGSCLPVPAGWSFSDAAALPEALFTVWSNVFQRGRLQPGESFLVHGGTSGIGMAALQLARAFNARAFATAGSDEKCRACEAAGAVRAINYRTEDFETVLKDQGVDVILDMIGGEYTAKNLRLLRPEGRLVFINAMKGGKAEFSAHQVMSRRLTITGSTLRARENAYKASLAADVEHHIWPLLTAGKFRANVCKTFPLAEAAAAHRLMESSAHVGKIVLTV
ncbi:NAD(P)H-quinone oxidoreductase [Opitutus sp. ER46]|uniref:NAD(P)H-quinone oxidoreductase n=1 Tax=Opitutus sp. ER46 TaxID=2161864 RepID=UPI000D307696|nr:NAD(P)H-quinone oxidoreductase [Opitutus sp. ER46]PTX97824.1 zinc-binding dehydrogenase [Opitutus sp. ER46]